MKKLPYKLNIQLFAEDNHENESDTIKAIREEYEGKIENQKNEYESKIKEMKKTHVEEIRALVSGRSENLSEETKKLQNQKPKLSFKEQLLKDTREKLGLKKEEK